MSFKAGRRLPPIRSRDLAMMGLGAASPFPKSAKALATNAKVYQAAYARAPDALRYAGVPIAQALLLNSIPMVKYEPPFTLDFLRKYFADPGSMINAQDGKPLRVEGREDHFAKILQWQLNNKTHPALSRPMRIWWGEKSAAYQKALTTIAGAALVATAAYFLAPAPVAGNAAQGAAAAAGATPAQAAAIGTSTQTAVASGATALTATTAAPAVTAGAAAGASAASIAATWLPVVAPVVSAITGVPIPTSLTSAGLTQYATEVATAQVGEGMRSDMEREIARQQAAMVAAGGNVTGSNPDLPPEILESQARARDMNSAVGWAILAGIAILAVSRHHRR